MPERVVDFLEPIEVDQQQPGDCARARRGSQGGFEAIDQQRAVRQPGECVVQGAFDGRGSFGLELSPVAADETRQDAREQQPEAEDDEFGAPADMGRPDGKTAESKRQHDDAERGEATASCACGGRDPVRGLANAMAWSGQRVRDRSPSAIRRESHSCIIDLFEPIRRKSAGRSFLQCAPSRPRHSGPAPACTIVAAFGMASTRWTSVG